MNEEKSFEDVVILLHSVLRRDFKMDRDSEIKIGVEPEMYDRLFMSEYGKKCRGYSTLSYAPSDFLGGMRFGPVIIVPWQKENF